MPDTIHFDQMNYQTFEPCKDLSTLAKYYWALENAKEEHPQRQTIVPDGCTRIIFHYGDLYKQYIAFGNTIIQPRCFVFGQLTKPLEIEPSSKTGVFSVRFYHESFLAFATINKEEMDVSLVLYELMPDDKYFFLTRYVGRVSYAKDNSKRQLLQPNKKERIPFVNTRFVSKKINEGSRLVLLLNNNKHPFEIINYGSGNPVSEETMKDAREHLQIKWHNESF